MGERRGTRGLELWCKRMTEGYPGVKVENMTTSWRDGLAFCAIIHHFRPELIDFSKLKKSDIFTNNELAFRVAEKYLGIPALLEAEDMVEYSVPDRLSILTYLAQFYQVFGATDSPSRLVPKRAATVPDRGIVSPASTSPPTKMAIRSASGSLEIPRREPCAKCNLPIFIAERLNVGKQVFHRTCFRCARCDSQLKLTNYYETETEHQYCCETCPDEEITLKPPAQTEETSVLTRSLSDEDKTKGLVMFQDDNYSTAFETALESDLSAPASEYTRARSQFINTQLVDSEISDDDLPQLPQTKPPVSDSAVAGQDNSKNVNKLSVNSDDSNQLKTASLALDNETHVVTKENVQNTSLVKSRMSLFQDNIDKMKTPEHRNQVLRSDSSINLELDKHTIKQNKLHITSSNKLSDDAIDISDDIITISDDFITISDDSTNVNSSEIVLSPNALRSSISDANSPEILKELNNSSLITEDSFIGDLSKKKIILDTEIVCKEEISFKETESIKETAFEELAKDFNVLEDEDIKSPNKSLVEASNEIILEDQNITNKEVLIKDIKVLGDTILDEVIKSPNKSLVEARNEIILEDHNISKQEELIKDIKAFYEDEDIKSPNNALVEASQEINLLETQSKEEIGKHKLLKKVLDEEKSSNNSLVEASEEIFLEQQIYPDLLNPFDDDIEEELIVKEQSSNPFGSEDEAEEEASNQIVTPQLRKLKFIKDGDTPDSLKAARGHRISVLPSNKPYFKSPTQETSYSDSSAGSFVPKPNKPSPKLRRVVISKAEQKGFNSASPMDSSNPFNDEDDDDFKVPKAAARSGKIAPPKISLNPFSSDEDDEDDVASKPIPKPRYSGLDISDNKPRTSIGTSFGGSTTSLSSVSSSIYSTRKKKAAPKPPTGSPQNSINSSPSTSVQHSPKPRKSRKAPLPPTSTPYAINKDVRASLYLSPIENSNTLTIAQELEKVAKDEVNRNRQSQTNIGMFPNKSTYGKWKRKKGQAPSLPTPKKRSIKQLPIKEVRRELDMIEVQLQGLEKQGVRLETIIREQCEGPDSNPNDSISIDAEDLILQLFEVVNERNELCRRQAEFIYLQKQHRLEEEHADVEYQIRCIMLQPEANKTDSDKTNEEQLLNRLVEIVERRNEIIDSLEMDRVRENAEDDSISSSMNSYASKRETSNVSEPEVKQKPSPKKKEKHKLLKLKKFKLKSTPKVDMDKDVDESESTTTTLKEKKKKKFNLF